MPPHAGRRLQVLRYYPDDSGVGALDEFFTQIRQRRRLCWIGFVHTGQLSVIGNGMKHSRNTMAATIASAILALPSGSSSYVGGWPTLSKNPNIAVQRNQIGELYRTNDVTASNATD